MKKAVFGFLAAYFLVLAVFCPMAGAQDIYEPDDTASAARVVVVDDADVQHHDFHRASDEDWVKFYALAGQGYEIRVSNAGPDCDAVIEVYKPDMTTLIVKKDDNPAGMSEKLPFRPDTDGLAYVRVRNYDGTKFGSNTSYELRVFRPIGPPLPGILSGRVYELTTGSPVDGAVLTSSGGSTGISSPSGFYFMHNFQQYITVSVNADGFRTFSADVTLTPGLTTTLDVPLEIDASSGCVARLHQDLALLIPRILVGDAMIWATLKYDPTRQDKIIFEVMGFGVVADVTGFAGCASPAVITDLSLHLPAISFDSMLLKAELKLESVLGNRIFFEVKAAEIISTPGL